MSLFFDEDVEICIGAGEPGHVILQVDCKTVKTMEIAEAEKLLAILSDAIRVARNAQPSEQPGGKDSNGH